MRDYCTVSEPWSEKLNEFLILLFKLFLKTVVVFEIKFALLIQISAAVHDGNRSTSLNRENKWKNSTRNNFPSWLRVICSLSLSYFVHKTEKHFASKST